MSQKHKELRTPFSTIDNRIEKHRKKDEAIVKVPGFLNDTMHQGKKVLAEHPWVEEFFNKNFTTEFDVFNTWFNEQLEEQKKTPLTQVINN